MFLFRFLFGMRDTKKALRFGQTLIFTDPTHPERPSPLLKKMPSTIFSLMQQAEDKKSTGNREIPGKPHDTKQTISSNLHLKRITQKLDLVRLGLVALVLTGNQTMVTLEGFQGKLELGLDGLSSHLLDLVGEDLGSGSSAVDTVGLDGDENTTANLEEPVGVHGDNTGLIGLGNIGKDDIDHGDDHAVTGRLTGVLNNGNNVGSLGGHGDEITAGSGRELDGVDVASRTDNVSDVRDGGTGGTTKVEDARARLDVDLISTTGDGSAKLASEGVPHAVLDLGGGSGAIVVLDRLVDGDALLAVDRLARCCVAGSKTIFLTTTDDKDAGVTVRLNNDLGTTSLTSTSTAATTARATSATTARTATGSTTATTSSAARTTTATEAAAITTETTAASTSAATTTTAASSRSERSHLNGMKRN